MSIIIKNYEWKETDGTITIFVPIRIGASDKVDIFNSTRYIKISYEQHLFEVVLLYETDIPQNRCTITDTNVIVELFKREKKLWVQLEPDISRKERNTLKLKLIEEEHKRFREECEEKKNKKLELKRVAVREQISLDTKQRNLIEHVRKHEKTEALGNVGDWIGENKIGNHVGPKKIEYRKKREIKNESAEEFETTINHDIKRIPVPSPRQPRTLEIEFTPREFPTPSRESRLEEENEWLIKQSEARRSAGFISDDIRPEERNPQFLKAKGDDFMRTQNYLGAISAYSFGIKLCNKYADLYIARSGAHLALDNYHKATQDCSAALELLKPEVPANSKERALCIGRRGVALCKLGMLQQGIGELRASLKILKDEYFAMELEHFEKVLEDKEDDSE